MANSKTYLQIGDDKVTVSTFEINNVEINYSLKDIKNYGQRNASYTKPITILRTKESDTIFKGLHNIASVNGYELQKKLNAKIVKNGITIFSGKLQVTDFNDLYYEVVIASDNINIFNILGDSYIKGNINTEDDIIFSASDGLYEHILDPSTIRYYLQNSPSDNGRGLFYPIIDFNNHINSVFDITSNYPFMPAIGIKQIFEKIIDQAGYTFYISNDISELMNKMYILCNNDSELIADYTYAKYFVDASTNIDESYPYLWVSEITTSPAYSIPMWCLHSHNYADHQFGYDYFKNPDISADPYHFVEGLDLPIGNINIDVSLSMGIINSLQSCDLDCAFKLYNYDGTIDTIPIDSITYSAESTTVDSINKSLTFYNPKKTKLWLTLNPDTLTTYEGTSDDGRIYSAAPVMPTLSSNIILTLKNTIFNKKTIDINDILPTKYKKKDFISDILTMFNCYIFDQDNKLNIKSYNDFYLLDTVDWSDKIDDKSIKISSLKNDQSKNIRYNYTNDNNDIYLKDFTSKYGHTFGNRNIINDSDFADGDKDLTLNISPTVEKRINTEYSFYNVDPSLYFIPEQEVIWFKWYDHFNPGDTILGVHRENYYDGLVSGLRDFTVKSNTKWHVRLRNDYPDNGNTDWVNCTPARAYGDVSINISVEPNGTNEHRSVFIEFTTDASNIADPERTIMLIQEMFRRAS